MLIAEKQFQKLFPLAKNSTAWTDALNEILPKYDITAGPRLWMFLAQCGHESAGFTAVQENLNYSRDALLRVFPKYFDRLNVDQYVRQPEKIANRVYANRMGNGNESSGDGWRYRGIGVLQITGRQNMQAFFKACYPDTWQDCKPEMLLEPKFGIEAACWFWKTRNLNRVSDREDVLTATKLINGGTHGSEDRLKRYATVKKLLCA